MVALFMDDDFMVFSSGTLSEDGANQRFDHMLAMCESVPFAKQPVIERASGLVVGYTGVDEFELDGQWRLEWGYRLVTDVRVRGYATEATRALLGIASSSFSGELLAIINPLNTPSQGVARKVGFTFWKEWLTEDGTRNLYTLALSEAFETPRFRGC